MNWSVVLIVLGCSSILDRCYILYAPSFMHELSTLQVLVCNRPLFGTLKFSWNDPSSQIHIRPLFWTHIRPLFWTVSLSIFWTDFHPSRKDPFSSRTCICLLI